MNNKADIVYVIRKLQQQEASKAKQAYADALMCVVLGMSFGMVVRVAMAMAGS